MSAGIPSVATVTAAQFTATLELGLLKLGQTLDGKVLSQQSNGLTKIATHAGVIELEIPQQLTSGTQLRLDVQKTAQGQTQIAVTIQHPETAGKGAPPAPTGTSLPASTAALPTALTSGGATALAADTAPSTPLGNATIAAPTQASLVPGAQSQNAVREVISQTIRQAATDQHSMAPLLANLDAITKGDSPALSPSIRAAASALLGLAVPVEQIGEGDALAGMLRKSGLFQEANLANAKTGQAVALDLKGALLNLKAALTGVVGEIAAQPYLGGTRPPPPRKGAPAVATAQDSPTISKASDATQAAKTLLAQTDGALDRLRLMQIASMPDAPTPMAGAPTEMQPQHLVMEFPVAYGPHQTGVMHLQVDHEDEKGKAAPGDEERTWKVRFAVDIDTVGPVHALIMLKGGFTSVQIWAERPQTAALFNHQLGDLRSSLAQAHLEVDDIQCRAGVPQAPAPPAGKTSGTFLDRQT